MMDESPYRPVPEQTDPDAALIRMAAKGQRRIEAKRALEAPLVPGEPDRRALNVRLALGAYHGTPVRTASYALWVVMALSLAVAIGGSDDASVGIAGVVTAVIALVAGLFCASAKTLATTARVDAERVWVTSLPFAVDGYFELLGDTPTLACVLVVDLEWEQSAPASVPAPDVAQGVVGLWDAEARVQPREGGALEIRSGRLVSGRYDSGLVETVGSFGNVLPDRRLARAVHRLVREALLPLHRSHAIARVSLRREATE